MENNLEMCQNGDCKRCHGGKGECYLFSSAPSQPSLKSATEKVEKHFGRAIEKLGETSYTTKQLLERDEKIARIVKEFREKCLPHIYEKTELWGGKDGFKNVLEKEIEAWLTEKLIELFQ